MVRVPKCPYSARSFKLLIHCRIPGSQTPNAFHFFWSAAAASFARKPHFNGGGRPNFEYSHLLPTGASVQLARLLRSQNAPWKTLAALST